MITPTEASTITGGDSDGKIYVRIYYYRKTEEKLRSVDEAGNSQAYYIYFGRE